MTCEDMMEIPELNNVLNLKAGEAGLEHSIRWIYFADCLQCVKNEYRIENYIHGGEFVVLTNRSLTDDSKSLMNLIDRMREHDIAALGINEGQISDKLMSYCTEHDLPLFELPELFPLIDLSQIMCQRLVLEENDRNSAEQLLSSILDAEYLDRDKVFAQARVLNIDLAGSFTVVEFAFLQADEADRDYLAAGQRLRSITTGEFASHTGTNVMVMLQTGSMIALIPVEHVDDGRMKEILNRIVDRAERECGTELIAGVGNATGYLEDVKLSRNEAAAAIKIARASDSPEHVVFYDELGLYTLISHIPDSRFLDKFVEDNLGRLINADRVNSGNLCETLEKYLNCNCNAKSTAEYMYLHRNTLNYRLNKIREILETDLDDLDTCMKLKMAFMIRNYRKLTET